MQLICIQSVTDCTKRDTWRSHLIKPRPHVPLDPAPLY
jgi:hypothetical protein